METCAKSYGSEGSLNQHIKLKHPEFYSATSAKAVVAGTEAQPAVTTPGAAPATATVEPAAVSVPAPAQSSPVVKETPAAANPVS